MLAYHKFMKLLGHKGEGMPTIDLANADKSIADMLDWCAEQSTVKHLNITLTRSKLPRSQGKTKLQKLQQLLDLSSEPSG